MWSTSRHLGTSLCWATYTCLSHTSLSTSWAGPSSCLLSFTRARRQKSSRGKQSSGSIIFRSFCITFCYFLSPNRVTNYSFFHIPKGWSIMERPHGIYEGIHTICCYETKEGEGGRGKPASRQYTTCKSCFSRLKYDNKESWLSRNESIIHKKCICNMNLCYNTELLKS